MTPGLVASAADTDVAAAGTAGTMAMLLGSTGGIGFFRGGSLTAAPTATCDAAAVGLLYISVDTPARGGGTLWVCTDGGWASTRTQTPPV